MENIFGFWYLFPISIMIATIAMSTGIGGAVFFSPLLMIGLKLEPSIAIGVALITEFFGFSSGTISYYRSKLIDFSLAKSLLMFSIPFTLLGSYFSHSINPNIVKSIFGIAIIIIGTQIYKASKKERKGKIKIPTPVAVGTSIFVVMITVFIASIGHIFVLSNQGSEIYIQVFALIIFTVPGVIIGGQIGPKLQNKLPEKIMKKFIAFIFITLGIFILSNLYYSYFL